jgi:heme A synthase
MQAIRKSFEEIGYWPIYFAGFLVYVAWCAIVWSCSARTKAGEFFSFGVTILFAGVIISVGIFNVIRSVPGLIAHFFTTTLFPTHSPHIGEVNPQADKRFFG